VPVQGCQTGLAGGQRGWEELHFSELFRLGGVVMFGKFVRYRE